METVDFMCSDGAVVRDASVRPTEYVPVPGESPEGFQGLIAAWWQLNRVVGMVGLDTAGGAGQGSEGFCPAGRVVGGLRFGRHPPTNPTLPNVVGKLALSCVPRGHSCTPVPPQQGGVVGDPHFKGFNGTRWSYQGKPGTWNPILVFPGTSLRALFAAGPLPATTVVARFALRNGPDAISLAGARARLPLASASIVNIG